MSTLEQVHQFSLFEIAAGTVLTGADGAKIQAKKQYTAYYRPYTSVINSLPAQMPKDEAQASFVYTTDGRLWWRKMERRRRPEAGFEVFRKRIDASPVWEIWAGRRGAQARYMRRYLVWNWHYGQTDRALTAINGNTLDDRIENIGLGDFIADGSNLQNAQSAPATKPDTGLACPCCGSPVHVLAPNVLARALQLPPQQETILRRVWNGSGKAVTAESIIADIYADDPEGGPEHEAARKYFNTQLCLLRGKLKGTGVRIEAAGYQRGFSIVIEG